MDGWQIEFFEEGDGERPVEVWLDGLAGRGSRKGPGANRSARRTRPALDYPYTSQIEGRLREVRLRFGKTRYRVFYFFNEAQEQVARQIGTSAPQVSRTEHRPEHANVQTLMRYADAVGMTLDVKLVAKR